MKKTSSSASASSTRKRSSNTRTSTRSSAAKTPSRTGGTRKSSASRAKSSAAKSATSTRSKGQATTESTNTVVSESTPSSATTPVTANPTPLSTTPPANPQLVALQAEQALRVLCRRRLIPFTQRLNPRYDAGWVHHDIARRLERFSDDVEKGLSPRLMLLLPPRSGKSELASRMFPAWHLGRYPDHEIIACSYNVSLAMTFSRKVKGVLEDPGYQSVFSTRLNPTNQSVEEWGLAGHRGGYVAAGVGGGITGKGAHCLPGPTIVSTSNGDLTISTLYQLESKPLVQTAVGPRRILAMTRREESVVYTIRFTSGNVLRATGKHPIYLPDRATYVTVEDLYGETQGADRPGVRVVREVLSEAALRVPEDGATRTQGCVLQPGVQPGAPRSEERQAMQDMRRADAKYEESEVLQQGVQAVAGAFEAKDLPGVLRGVSASVFVHGLLRGDLRRYGALDPHDWEGELELQGRQFLQLVVRPDARDCTEARQGLCSVQGDAQPALSPRQRSEVGQQTRELGDVVRDASQSSPQVCYDTVSVVERVCDLSEPVYDIQVEEAGCFFADQVLVGNCLIIDDPIKNAEEADSAEVREKLWDWYGSTAYTRLAPGGGVLVAQTHWHDDDLAGRLKAAMADDPEADRFEVIKYPAIAEDDEYLDLSTDLIVYGSEIDPDPTNYKLLRCKGEALHPQRYDIQKLNRIRKTIPKRFWSALYQQNPVPDDGAYFTKEQFKQAETPNRDRCKVMMAWDFAISEKKQNDYTVGTVGYQDDDDILHIPEVVRFKSGDAFFIVEQILDLAERHKSKSLQVGFEDGQIFKAIQAVLKKRMRERRIFFSIVVLTPITDKMARARPLQARMQQGLVCYADNATWFDTVRAEMLRFPAGVHDDCVDSQAWLAAMAVDSAPPQKPKPQTIKSWKDRISVYGRVGTPSHMAA